MAPIHQSEGSALGANPLLGSAETVTETYQLFAQWRLSETFHGS